jgi:hypothetical protein
MRNNNMDRFIFLTLAKALKKRLPRPKTPQRSARAFTNSEAGTPAGALFASRGAGKTMARGRSQGTGTG